jgi:signal peptidase I
VYILVGVMIQGSNLGYALHIRSSLFEAFRIPAASVYPNIIPNDRILVNKTAYRHSDPRRGDLVLFRPPNEHWRSHYIKRIVALPGDTVSLQSGRLYINGQELPLEPLEPTAVGAPGLEIDGRIVPGEYARETNGSSEYVIFRAGPNDETAAEFSPMTVPEHHCFVLGDNRDRSRDSRNFGPIPFAAVRGRADYIYWPAQKWSRFGSLR